jgi:M6 family metalloprotease-like protein
VAACVCLSGLASLEYAPVPLLAQDQPSQLDGWLTVVWPDAQPGETLSLRPDRPIFTLHADDGRRWRLEPHQGAPPPDHRLAGRRVTVGVARALRRPISAAVPDTARFAGTAWVTTVRRALPENVEAAVAEAAIVAADAVTGTQRWVTLACKFSDVAAEPKTLSFFSDMYSSSHPGLDHYWRELSFDQIDVLGSSAHGWFTLPKTRAEYLAIESDSGSDAFLDALANDCTKAAEPSVDFRSVKGINQMFNDTLDGHAWGGTAFLTLDGVRKSWRVTWAPPWAYNDISIVEHEMGHSFNWPHSSTTYQPVLDPYDNAWDVMSEDRYNCSSGSVGRHPVYGCTGQHTIAHHKDLAGWIPTDRKWVVARGAPSASVTVEPLSGLPTGTLDGLPAGSYLAAVVQTPDPDRFYMVEARRRTGYDSKLFGDGVVIHEVDLSRTTDDQPAHLMDADNPAESGDAGAVWTVGESFTDPTAGVVVRVDAATATGYVVTLASGATPPAVPTITGISPAAGPTAGGTAVSVTGTGFTTTTVVSFGGVPAASQTFVGPTSLGAVTPPHAAGAVEVTVGSGPSGISFSYLPVPTITAVTPATGSTAGGTTITITGSGFVADATSVTVGGLAASRVEVVGPTSLTAVVPAHEAGPVGVTVTTAAGTAVLTGAFTYTPATGLPTTYAAYLAEGATGSFFDLDIAIANPNKTPVATKVRFLKADGATVQADYALSPLSRLTIAADDVPGLDVGQVDVSTVVESPQPLVVERTMFWNQEDYHAGHGGAAVSGAARTWYFAEGYQGVFDTYILLANAGSTPATVTLRFLRESEPPFTATVVVGANARYTVHAGAFPQLQDRGFATVVNSDVPVIAERAMYFGAVPFWKAGHESPGVPSPALQWSLAEGATGSFFDTYVLVANPNDAATSVTFRFLLGGANEGRTYTKTVEVPGHARYTLNPEALAATAGFTGLADAAVSTLVTAADPIVVERAMYWPGGLETWTEAHNSFGLTEAGTRWGLSEGRVGGARQFETYVLLANATAIEAAVTLTWLRESGPPIETRVRVAATSRYNVFVNADVPGLTDGERFGVLIESQPVPGAPAGVPITVERAMYWDSAGEAWAGGTNATAVKLP